MYAILLSVSERKVKTLNILYCGDANMCDGIFLSALSLARQTTRALHVYILTAHLDAHTAIPQTFAEKLEGALCADQPASRVICLDISDRFGGYLPLANLDTRFTPFCMLRLFADEVPGIPDRILYLDADVMCRAPLDVLYDTPMEDFEIAGVPDRYGKWFFGNFLRHDYLNSGVLLLNMARIRESGLFAACRTMCRDKKMFMPDQTALNKLAAKKKLPRRYNEQGSIRGDTVLKHFTTFFRFVPYFHPVTIKQWDTDKLHDDLGVTEFDAIINEYTEKYK